MNKELANALIGLAIIAIIIIPIIIYSAIKKAKKVKKLASFLSMAEKQKLILSDYELMDFFSIGLDKKNLKIFYIRGNENEGHIVDLRLIRKCELANISKNYSFSSKNIEVVDRLELVLKYKDSTISDTIIEFFNVEKSAHVNNELHLLEKWVHLISSLLKSK